MGAFFALFSASAFSISYLLLRRGMKQAADDGAFITTFVNMLIFWVLVGLLALGSRLPPLTARGLLLFTIAGLFTTYGGRSLHCAAIRLIGPSRAAGIRCSSPAVTTILAILVLRESLTLLELSGIAAVLAGIFLLSRETAGKVGLAVLRPTQGNGAASVASFLGLVTAVLAALSFGIGHLVRKLGVLEVPSPFWGVAIGSTVACLAMLLQASLQGSVRELLRNNFTLVLVPRSYLLAGVFTATGQLSSYLGIYLASVSLATVLASTEPLHTLALSRFILGNEEPLTWRLVAGAVLMVTGIILLLVKPS